MGVGKLVLTSSMHRHIVFDLSFLCDTTEIWAYSRKNRTTADTVKNVRFWENLWFGVLEDAKYGVYIRYMAAPLASNDAS